MPIDDPTTTPSIEKRYKPLLRLLPGTEDFDNYDNNSNHNNNIVKLYDRMQEVLTENYFIPTGNLLYEIMRLAYDSLAISNKFCYLIRIKRFYLLIDKYINSIFFFVD